MNRPIDDKKKAQARIWKKAMREKRIEHFEEEEVFHLTPEEAKKCRYEMTDNTERMAECTIHTRQFTHGIRMHPPHLYDIRDGKVYYKSAKGWQRWYPNAKANKARITEDKLTN